MRALSAVHFTPDHTLCILDGKPPLRVADEYDKYDQRQAADEQGIGALIVEQHARKALKYSDRMYLMSRGQIRMEMSATEALGRLDEIEEAYLAGTAESEEDHIERKRRKDVRKAWGRQRVRERELRRLTGTQVSRRHTAEDDDILDREQQRRDWQIRARRGRKY